MVRVLLFLLIISLLSLPAFAFTVTGDLPDELKETIITHHHELGEGGIIALLEANNIDVYSFTDTGVFASKGFRIKQISFAGNRAFLKSELISVTGIYENDLYNANNLPLAQSHLKAFYQSHGFLDVQVSYTAESGRIRFEIIPGIKRIIIGTKVLGIDTLTLPVLDKNLVLNPNNVAAIKEQLDIQLRKKGYFENKIDHQVITTEKSAYYYDSAHPLQSLRSFFPGYTKGVILEFFVKKGEQYDIDINCEIDESIGELVEGLTAENLLNIDIFNIRNLETVIESALQKMEYAGAEARVSVEDYRVIVHVSKGKLNRFYNVRTRYKKLPRDEYIDKDAVLLEKDVASFKKGFIELLKDHGYYDAQIEKEEHGKTKITFHIDEGKQYQIGKMVLAGTVYEEMVGTVADKKGIDAAVVALSKIVEGQYYFDFLPIQKVEKKANLKVDLIFKNSLQSLTCAKVMVNHEILEWGIEQNIIRSGDPITKDRVKRIEQFIRAQSFVTSHKLTLIPVGETSSLLVIHINEKKKNEFFGGFSYDSIDKLSFHIGYRLHNIFDTAHELEFLGADSFRETYGRLRLFSNGIFIENLENFIDISARYRDEDDYQFNQEKLSLGLGSRLDSFMMSTAVYAEHIYIGEDRFTNSIREQITTEFFQVGLQGTLTFYDLDNPANPKNGIALKLEMNPVVSDATAFYAQTAGAAVYATFFDRFLTSIKADAGLIAGDDLDIPLTYRYTLGGPYQMRAFSYRDIGTKDEQGHVLGGKGYYYGEISEHFIVNDFFMVGGFYEVGQAGESLGKLAQEQDIGAMVSIITPLGPLKFSYAVDLNNYQRRAFYITFGTRIP